MITWQHCRNILCIRPDNMGDLLMSAPAIAALKETFGCAITVLTSSRAANIAKYIPGIDDVLVWDVPWVKGTHAATAEEFNHMVNTVRERNFDAAVIFTVFSQNPQPAALMAMLAGIPNRLAYCRENPYDLLSVWIPEKEPYTFIRHQVTRDLDLVRSVGAKTSNEKITLHLPAGQNEPVKMKLLSAGIDPKQPWLIMHPGVSEPKRQYPTELWIEAGREVNARLGHQIIVTGGRNEKPLAEKIANGIGLDAVSLAGDLTLEEFATLIEMAPLLISVNTGSIHLAAALQTKMIVLYALTNPQHTPWKGIGKLLPFSIAEALRSRNEVLRFVHCRYFSGGERTVNPHEISDAAYELLVLDAKPEITHLSLLEHAAASRIRAQATP